MTSSHATISQSCGNWCDQEAEVPTANLFLHTCLTPLLHECNFCTTYMVVTIIFSLVVMAFGDKCLIFYRPGAFPVTNRLPVCQKIDSKVNITLLIVEHVCLDAAVDCLMHVA